MEYSILAFIHLVYLVDQKLFSITMFHWLFFARVTKTLFFTSQCSIAKQSGGSSSDSAGVTYTLLLDGPSFFPQVNVPLQSSRRNLFFLQHDVSLQSGGSNLNSCFSPTGCSIAKRRGWVTWALLDRSSGCSIAKRRE